MIELSPGLIAAIMLGAVLVGCMTGYPLGIVIGAIGIIMGILVFGDAAGQVIYNRIVKLMMSYPLLAVPLFVYMGVVLEGTGIAEKMLDAFYLLLSGLKGGLALITMLMGTILAMTVGVISASVTMLGLVALPLMLKKGYDKALATGTVCAGGVLGILIPPSIMLVIYADMSGLSTGKLLMAAFMPGFLLSALYMSYIAIRCQLEPQLGPPVPLEERRGVPLSRKISLLMTSLVPPLVVILAVLGTIFFGIAAPTESAGIGAFVVILMAFIYRKFSWQVAKATSLSTLQVCGMIFLIATASFAFVGVFIGAGADKPVQALILATPGGRWGAWVMIQIIVFVLGMFMDWIGICFLMIPIFSPMVPVLGFDPLWFGMTICINLQTAFMSPPFAMAIFIVRGIAPPEFKVTTAQIIRGVIPFIVLILIGMALCVAFPEIILWLPSKMIK